MLKLLKKYLAIIHGYFRRESIMEEEERIFGKKEVEIEDLKEELLQKPGAKLSEPIILDVPKPRPAIKPIEPNPRRRAQTQFYNGDQFAGIGQPKKDKD